MSIQRLDKAPLIEAIFEIRWRLVEQAPGLATDPKYKILVGRLYDRFAKDYPFHEALPTASMPDEMMGYVVQHRFRAGEGRWPLIQVGPGIVTCNDTKNYSWDDFEKRCNHLLDELYKAYPDDQNTLNITNLQLRYIDAIQFDFTQGDILKFIEDNLKIRLSFPPVLFDDTPIGTTPTGINAWFAFPTTNPIGELRLRFARGMRDQQNALIWETVVYSNETNLPEMPGQFRAWLESAHSVTHNMFFKLIEGALEERFR